MDDPAQRITELALQQEKTRTEQAKNHRTYAKCATALASVGLSFYMAANMLDNYLDTQKELAQQQIDFVQRAEDLALTPPAGPENHFHGQDPAQDDNAPPAGSSPHIPYGHEFDEGPDAGTPLPEGWIIVPTEPAPEPNTV